jgi:leader peptidase (prepilin peptidase)/N-methyltransferase
MPFNYAELAAEFPWFFPVMAGVFGALIGSFLNVCIYRIPAGKSIVWPGSQCACGKPIAWYDNIPVLSWFILRGRARCCGRPYSFRYAFVELLTAGLFLWSWLRFAPESPGKAVGGMLFIAVLICATFIDLDHMIIPDVFTIWAGVVGVILSFAAPALHGQSHEIFLIASFRSGVDALLGLLVGSGLVLWIALLAEEVLKKEAMGFGDVKFVGMIGAFCGWHGAVCSIFGGALVGTVWFVFALIWLKIFPPKAQVGAGRAEAGPGAATPATIPASAEGSPEAAQESAPLGFGVHVPFGPMLAMGALLYFLVADRWIAAYFAELNSLL